MDAADEHQVEPDIKPDRSVLYFALVMGLIILVMALISIYLEDIQKIFNPPNRPTTELGKEEAGPATDYIPEDDQAAIKTSLIKFIESFYLDQNKGYFDPPSYFAPITKTYYNYHNLTYQGLKRAHNLRLADFKNRQQIWLVHTLNFERNNDSLIVTFWTRQNYYRPSRNADESGEILLEMVLNKEDKIISLRELQIRNWVSAQREKPADHPPATVASNSNTSSEPKEKEAAEPPVYSAQLVDTPPEFNGGQAKLARYLNRNLKYPSRAREQNVQGKVFISFIIEPTGDLSNFTVMRGIGSGCDEEALRVLRSSPNWKPGILEGKPVRTRYVLPIIFRLAD